MEIQAKLREIITTIRAKDLLNISIDGVAPLAKINQQRSRRFKDAMEEDTKEDDVRFGLVNHNKFDKRQITPGTEFMFKASENIKRFLAQNQDLLPDNLIYSPHTTKGEGEHKIFDNIRKGKYKFDHPAYIKPSHVIYGADSDLVMLSLLADIEKIYLVKEDYKAVVDIDMLRDKIYNQMTINSVIKTSKKIVIQDYVLMSFAIGNDFLPHLVAFGDVSEVIIDMIGEYQRVTRPLNKDEASKPFTNEDGSIIWENYLPFIRVMATKEPTMLEEIAKIRFDNPIDILDSAVDTYKADDESHKLIGGIFKKIINYPKFRLAWYGKVFLPQSESARRYVAEHKIPAMTGESLEEMCKNYLEGLQWVMLYYMGGMDNVNPRYIYKYFYGPLLTDIAFYLDKFINDENTPLLEDLDDTLEYEEEITYIHQLMMVLPTKSFYLIPERYRHLVSRNGPLSDMIPTSFQIDYSGTNRSSVGANGKISHSTEYKGIVLMPFVDIDRIMRVIAEQSPELIPENDVISTEETIYTVAKGPGAYSGYHERYVPRGRGGGGFRNNSDRGGRGGARGGGGFQNNSDRGGRGGYHHNSSDRGGRGRGRGRGAITIGTGLLM